MSVEMQDLSNVSLSSAGGDDEPRAEGVEFRAAVFDDLEGPRHRSRQ